MDQKTSQNPPNHSANTSSLKLGGAETVTINVGPGLQPFKIHGLLICNASAFFRKAFISKFKEGLDLEIALPYEDEEIFELFAQWLCTKQYHYTLKQNDASSRRTVQPLTLYIFADKYEISALQQQLIGVFFAAAKAAQSEPPVSMIEHVYDNTSRDDKLRLLLVDWWWMYRYTEMPLPLDNNWLYDTAAFAVDLLRGSVRKRLGGDPFNEEMAEEYF